VADPYRPTEDWHEGYQAGYEAGLRTARRDIGSDLGDPGPKSKAKKPRKAHAYNLEYKKQYAKLKKKHPRTSFAGLAKKAHKATKKVMK